MATYVNDLRLKEIATGDESGTWGTSTNTNLELIGEALGYGTQDCFASDADATTTVADGASDPARAMYFKVTSSATLTATRTLTIAPNTISRVMLIENATTGSQSITISQGSGSTVTIASGAVKMVYLDGAGAGGAVVEALADLELPTVTVADLTATTADINAGTIDGTVIGGTTAAAITGTTITGTSFVSSGDMTFGDSDKAIFGAGSDLQIYHDGSNSYIDENGTGHLFVRSNGDGIYFRSSTNEEIAHFNVNGSVKLYHDNAEKLATTATGIDVTGTVTADGLTVDGDATITSASTNSTGFTIGNTAASGVNWTLYSSGGGPSVAGSFGIYNNSTSTNALILSASNNLGLGVAPSAWSQGSAFELLAPGMGLWNGSGSPSSIYMTSNAYFNGGFKYGGNGEASHYYQYLGQHVWSTATSGTAGNAISFTQAMTLDTSGNLLVGKTATGFGTAGIEARSGGTLWATASETNAASFNRLSTDGAIAYFSKDGATVGSIGTETSNSDLYIGNGDTAIMFHDGVDAIFPHNASTNAGRDAAIDIGYSTYRFKDLYLSGGVRGTSTIDITIPETSGGAIQLEFGNNVNDTRRTVRAYKDNFEPAAADTGVISLGQAANKWKDLYLSGGVYLGGTGAANKLDDYEEGTFTPTVIGDATAGTATYSHQKGVYTKIGNVVTIQIYLNWSSGTGAGVLRFSNLPFTLYATSGFYSSATIGEYSNIAGTAGHTLCALGLPNTVDIQFAENDFSSAPATTAYDAEGYIILSMTYLAA